MNIWVGEANPLALSRVAAHQLRTHRAPVPVAFYANYSEAPLAFRGSVHSHQLQCCLSCLRACRQEERLLKRRPREVQELFEILSTDLIGVGVGRVKRLVEGQPDSVRDLLI